VGRNWKDNVSRKYFAQLFWGIEGAGVFFLNGREYILDPGRVFLYRPGDEHRIESRSGRWNYRWMTMDGSFFREILSGFNFPRTGRFAGTCPEELFKRLELEIFDITVDGQREAAATAYTLLSRALCYNGKLGRADIIAGKCVELISARFAEPELDILAVAASLKIHRSTLSRIFRKKKGISPGAYLISVRIQKALSLLKDTSFNVSEIAFMTGFSDPNYFSKVFKKNIGISPLQFRKS
jgi:AraC-like DNA-binding protein